MYLIPVHTGLIPLGLGLQSLVLQSGELLTIDSEHGANLGVNEIKSDIRITTKI